MTQLLVGFNVNGLVHGVDLVDLAPSLCVVELRVSRLSIPSTGAKKAAINANLSEAIYSWLVKASIANSALTAALCLARVLPSESPRNLAVLRGF